MTEANPKKSFIPLNTIDLFTLSEVTYDTVFSTLGIDEKNSMIL